MKKAIIFDWVGTLSEGSRDLYPDSERVLQECKNRGYQLGLISIAGYGVESRLEDIRATGIWNYFDDIVASLVKTPEIYRDSMKRLGAVPAQTWVVDDRMLKGIQIGNSLGCKTCWIQAGRYAQETPTEKTGEPRAVISSISDLLSII